MNTTPVWQDPTVVGINKETAHTPWGCYPDLDSARACTRNSSPFVQLLNGTWRFRLTRSPDEMPERFAAPSFDDTGWQTIGVPGNWQLDPGCWDRPIYTNMLYPFEPDPPRVPEVNPTGCYRTTFTVPDSWLGRDLFICFESVDSALLLWVNGTFVGYSQDSRLPAEFNITAHCTPGVNCLAAKVLRYCDGTYLEKQDYWQMSGIQRDVLLMAKPRVHLRDYKISTSLNGGSGTAMIRVRAFISPAADTGSYRVEAQLYDERNEPVFREFARAAVAGSSPMYNDTTPEKFSAVFDLPVDEPRLWSDEDPYLYTLVLRLIGSSGTHLDYEAHHVGVRAVEVPDGLVTLNGKPVEVRGVNRHEFHHRTGRYVESDWMEREIRLMKQLNFNAVRTSHYPNCTRWYELCDRYGILVVDETNLETHGVEAQLSKDPAWLPAYIDRARNMVLRDKNHPCILFWSLGNESSWGPHHAAMAAWIRHYDPTRLVQYESGDPPPSVSDIRAPMYPDMEWVERQCANGSDSRPVIMCEYAYAKGNSGGNFASYWKAIREHRRFQGGFVWDWSDKAILTASPDRKEFWGYGGDMGEKVLDPVPEMCCNGVVWPDLTLHPGAYEIKQVQSPVWVSTAGRVAHDRVVVNIHNGYRFTSLAHLDLRWAVTNRGTAVSQGSAGALSAQPGHSEQVSIPLEGKRLRPGDEYLVNVSLVLARDLPWGDAGHELYWNQFPVAVGAPAVPVSIPAATDALRVNEDGELIEIAGGSFRAVFSRAAGSLTALRYGALDILARETTECFYRAPTGIDRGTNVPGQNYAWDWREAGIDSLERSVSSVELHRIEPGLAEVRMAVTMRSSVLSIDSHIIYRLRHDGDIMIGHELTVPEGLPPLPRIGLTFAVCAELGNVEWYGRGPWENYPDRKSAAPVGRYRSRAEAMLTPYIRPSECGGREDCRWVALTCVKKCGLLIVGSPLFHFSALPCALTELERAAHPHEIARGGPVHVHLDHRHLGLGGHNGWFRNVAPRYRIDGGNYRYSFLFHPLGSDDDPDVRALHSGLSTIFPTRQEGSLP